MSGDKPNYRLRRLPAEDGDEELEVFDAADSPGPNRRSFLAALALIAEEIRGVCAAASQDGDDKDPADDAAPKSKAKPAAGWGNHFLIAAHRGSISGLAVSSDGAFLATAALDRSVKIWEMPGGLLRKWWPDGRRVKLLPAKHGDIRAIRMSAPMQAEAVFIKDSEIQMYRLPSDDRVPPLRSAQVLGSSAAISGDGRTLVAATEAKQIQFWNVEERKQRGQINVSATALALSPDGRLAARGGANGQVQVWSVADGKFMLQHGDDPRAVTAVATIARPLVAAWAQETTVFVAKSADEPVIELNGQHRFLITALAISPDGRYVVSGDKDGVVVIWDLTTRERVASLFDPTISAGDATAFQLPGAGSSTTVMYTLPCGSPTPPGATCVCNCVPGVATRIALEQQRIQQQLEREEQLRWQLYWSMMNSGVNTRRSSSSTCTCNSVCTCNKVYY